MVAILTLYFRSRGEPFVLRDAEIPKQNLRTYTGISSDRLEQLEGRLKKDIVNEAEHCNGLVLVHDELGMFDICASRDENDYWFQITKSSFPPGSTPI